MKIVGKCIICKSTNEFWWKEFENTKPNTERIVDKDVWKIINEKKPDRIMIENVDKDDAFEALIIDISKVGELLGKIIIVISFMNQIRK